MRFDSNLNVGVSKLFTIVAHRNLKILLFVMATKINQKEYLKRYLAGDVGGETKTKKKKKKEKSTKVNVTS